MSSVSPSWDLPGPEGTLSPRPFLTARLEPSSLLLPGRIFPGRKWPLGGHPIPAGVQGYFLPHVGVGPALNSASPGQTQTSCLSSMEGPGHLNFIQSGRQPKCLRAST